MRSNRKAISNMNFGSEFFQKFSNPFERVLMKETGLTLAQKDVLIQQASLYVKAENKNEVINEFLDSNKDESLKGLVLVAFGASL